MVVWRVAQCRRRACLLGFPDQVGATSLQGGTTALRLGCYAGDTVMLLDVAVVRIWTGGDEIKTGAIGPAEFEARPIALIGTGHTTFITLLGDGVAKGRGQAGVDHVPIETTRRAAL